MKKIIVIVFTLIFFAINANAQVQRESNPTQNVATNSDKKSDKLAMMKSLDLTKEQMGQLKEFRRSMKDKKDAITNDQSLTETQRKSKLQDLHKEQKEKLNSILTPEQMDKLKKERNAAKMQKGNTNKSDSTTSMLDN